MYNISKDQQTPAMLLGVWKPNPGPDPQDLEMCLTWPYTVFTASFHFYTDHHLHSCIYLPAYHF